MSFSPFDPDVMRRVLGRAAPQAASRPRQDSPVARLEDGADFQTARLNDAYASMEKGLRELVSLPFIQEDAETLRRIEALLFSADMEEFANQFERVARHIEARLSGNVDGPDESARSGAPVMRPAAAPVVPGMPSSPPPQLSGNRPVQNEGTDTPPLPAPRLRLNL